MLNIHEICRIPPVPNEPRTNCPIFEHCMDNILTKPLEDLFSKNCNLCQNLTRHRIKSLFCLGILIYLNYLIFRHFFAELHSISSKDLLRGPSNFYEIRDSDDNLYCLRNTSFVLGLRKDQCEHVVVIGTYMNTFVEDVEMTLRKMIFITWSLPVLLLPCVLYYHLLKKN